MDLSQLEGQSQPQPQNQTTTTQTPSLDVSSLTNSLMPVVGLSAVITILFLIAYIISMVRRWKVQRAIFDIQKNVREMNERARTPPPTPPRVD